MKIFSPHPKRTIAVYTCVRIGKFDPGCKIRISGTPTILTEGFCDSTQYFRISKVT